MTARVEEREKWDRLAGPCPADIPDHQRNATLELAALLDALDPRPVRLLEAGCGTGVMSMGLANLGFEVDLLDFSEQMLRSAREGWPRHVGRTAPAPRFFLSEIATASPESLDTEPYDCVFNAGVLEHYDEADAIELLRGMARLSRRHVVAIVPNARCALYRWWRWRLMREGQWTYGKEIARSSLEGPMLHAGLDLVFEAPVFHLTTIELARELARDGSDLLAWLDADDLPAEVSAYAVCAVGRVGGPADAVTLGAARRDTALGVQTRWIEQLQREQRQLRSEVERERNERATGHRRIKELEARLGQEREQLRRELRAEVEAVRAEAVERLALVHAEADAARGESAQLQAEAEATRAEAAAVRAAAEAEVAVARAQTGAARAEAVAMREAARARELEQSREIVLLREQRDADRAAQGRREEELLQSARFAAIELKAQLGQEMEKLRRELRAEVAAVRAGAQAEVAAARAEAEAASVRREEVLLERTRLAEFELEKAQGELHEARMCLHRIENALGYRVLQRLKRVRDRLLFLSATHELLPSLRSILEASLCWTWRLVLPRDLGALFDARNRDPEFYHHGLRVFTEHPEPWRLRYYATVDTREAPRRRVRVSLIATVLNEAGSVRSWMRSIAAQSRLPDELVIVDGGSRDGTAEQVRQDAAGLGCQVRVIVEPGCNIARGRNIAIRSARFECIAVTDAGCELARDWLRHIVAPFEFDESVDAVIGWSELYPESSAWSRSNQWLVVSRLEDTDPKALLPSSRSFAFRKTVVNPLGGYPEHLTRWGEDTLLCLNLTGTRARWAFAPEAVAYWMGPNSWWSFLRTRYHYQLGNGEARTFEGSAGLVARCVATTSVLALLALTFLIAGLFQPKFLLGSVACGLLGARYFWKSAHTEWIRNLRPRWRAWHGRMLKPATKGWLTACADTAGTLRGRWRSRRIVLRRVLDPAAETVVFPRAYEWFWMKQRPGQLAEAFARRGLQVVFCPNNHRERTYGGLLRVGHNIVLCNDPECLKVLERTVVFSVAAHHFRRGRTLGWSGARFVLDIVDDIWATKSTSEDLRSAVDRADLVSAVSRRLAAAVKAASGIEPVVIPNGVDAELWHRRGQSAPPDIAGLVGSGMTIIGYSGALGFWFDFELLAAVARSRPEWRFVLIGPVMDEDAARGLARRPRNVIHLGLKDHRELPAYVEQFHVGVVPFRVMDGTDSADPIKIYEYAALEVPIVCTDHSGWKVHESVQLASTPSAFVQALEHAAACRNEPELRRSLRDFAVRNTWDQRAATILGLLGGFGAGGFPREGAA